MDDHAIAPREVRLEGSAETHRRFRVQRPNSFALLFAGVVFLMATTSLHANQVYKPCGKKWSKRVSKLDADQLAWMSQQRSATYNADLDDDGKLDLVEMTNTPSFRNCGVKDFWDHREVTVKISYGDGRSQLFYWISVQLVDRMIVYPGIGRILLVGVDPTGRASNKWVVYQTALPGKVPAALVAGAPPREGTSGEGPYHVADLPADDVLDTTDRQHE